MKIYAKRISQHLLKYLKYLSKSNQNTLRSGSKGPKKISWVIRKFDTNKFKDIYICF